MTDIFTGGTFMELPSVSIDTDCSEWFPVLASCLEYCHERGLIAGDVATNKALVENALNWLVENDCDNN